MKKLLAVFLAVLFVLPMAVFQGSAVTLAPSDGWSDMWLTHFNTQYSEGSGAIVLDEEFNVHQTWKINYAFAPVAELPGVYEIVEINNSLDGSANDVAAVPDGGFIYSLNYGNDYTATGGTINYTSDSCSNMINSVKDDWAVGDRFQFKNLNLESLVAPTLTPTTNWYDDAYICTAKYRKYVPGEEPVREMITVDGVHDDNGWNSNAWQVIDGNTAHWQKEFADKSLSAKYQILTDDLRIYVAAVVYGTPVAGSGNGSATNFRIWFNTTSTSTTYTHYFDVYYSAETNGAGVNVKNVDASTINAALTLGESQTNIEFSVPFSAIGAAGLSNIPYFISCSTNNGTEEPCIYYPKLYATTDAPYANMPYNAWYRANDGDLNPAAVRLNDFEYTLKADGTYEVSGIGTYASNEIVIPSQYSGIAVTSVGERAFFDNASITKVVIPDSVLSLENYAFAKCASLNSVDLGNGLQKIGFAAFALDTALTSISFPASLTTIDRWAFNGCSKLGSAVTIPATVTTVGARAFGNCDALTDIFCMMAEQPSGWSTLWTEYCEAEIHWVSGGYILGDLNADTFVDSVDLVILAGIIAESSYSEYQFLAGDTNEDGNLDSIDLVVLAGMIAAA